MKTLYGFFFALALAFSPLTAPPAAKADNEYPTCNTSDNITTFDGMDQENDDTYTGTPLSVSSARSLIRAAASAISLPFASSVTKD